MHLVAKGQRYDSLHKGFMFFKELNVFMSTLYYHLKQLVGREPVGKNKMFNMMFLYCLEWDKNGLQSD